ncbi:MAG: aldo/keto reductase [Planctomycetota bacterium]
MRYTLWGTRSGIRVSRVALGAMRFGTDTDKAVRTIRAAIDGGVNYIDTSPHYCDDKSESILGEALQDGYRVADLPPLDAGRRRRIDGRVKGLRRQFDRICTWCEYCKGCPQNIRIPYIFGQYIHLKVLGLRKRARTSYRQYLKGEGWNTGGSPLACTACGACEKKCPNRIPIIRQLKDAHRALTGR